MGKGKLELLWWNFAVAMAGSSPSLPWQPWKNSRKNSYGKWLPLEAQGFNKALSDSKIVTEKKKIFLAFNLMCWCSLRSELVHVLIYSVISSFAWYVRTRSSSFSRLWGRMFVLGNSRCSKCWPLWSFLLMSREQRACFWLALLNLPVIHYEECAIRCSQFNLPKTVKIIRSSQKVTFNILSLTKLIAALCVSSVWDKTTQCMGTMIGQEIYTNQC